MALGWPTFGTGGTREGARSRENAIDGERPSPHVEAATPVDAAVRQHTGSTVLQRWASKPIRNDDDGVGDDDEDDEEDDMDDDDSDDEEA